MDVQRLRWHYLSHISSQGMVSRDIVFYTARCKNCVIDDLVGGMAMNGKITTWFKEKGFGFIKDENGENRYFHVIKVANPELIKKDAAVTFEPTTNNKGPSAYAVKVIPDSKYIFIAGERIKLTSIKSYLVYSEEVPADTRIDKENAVLSVGVLMGSIRPKTASAPGEMRKLKKLAITTFQGTTLIFTADEIDIDATVKMLKV